MKLLTPNRKVSIGLVVLTVCLIIFGDMLGMVPHEDRGTLDGRKKFYESLAVQFSIAASRDELDLIKDTLITMVNRDPDVLSAAIRNQYDRVLIRAGDLWFLRTHPLRESMTSALFGLLVKVPAHA